MSPAANHLPLPSSSSERSERRERVVTLVLWCLVLLTFIGFRPPRHPSELMQSGGFDWQVQFQAAVWVLLGLVGLGLLATRRADLRLLQRGPLFWYTGFILYALASAAWSSAPMLTAYRATQHGVALVLIISMRKQLQQLPLLLTIYVAINWVFVTMAVTGLHGGMDWIASSGDETAFLARPGDMQWRFSSTAGHPSHISIVAAVAAIAYAARAHGRHWKRRSLGCLWMIVTTVLTVSRTAIAGMAGGLTLVAFGRQKLAVLLCVAGTVIPMLLMLDPVRDKATAYLRRGQTSQQFTSMTGRMPIYEQVMEDSQQHLMTGVGFQSMRVEPIAEGWLHTHNLFLESLTSLGVVGVVFALLVMLSTAGSVIQQLLRHAARRGLGHISVWENAAMAVPLFAFCILDVGYFAAMNAAVMTYIAVMAKVQTELMDEVVLPVAGTSRLDRGAWSSQAGVTP